MHIWCLKQFTNIVIFFLILELCILKIWIYWTYFYKYRYQLIDYSRLGEPYAKKLNVKAVRAWLNKRYINDLHHYYEVRLFFLFRVKYLNNYSNNINTQQTYHTQWEKKTKKHLTRSNLEMPAESIEWAFPLTLAKEMHCKSHSHSLPPVSRVQLYDQYLYWNSVKKETNDTRGFDSKRMKNKPIRESHT